MNTKQTRPPLYTMSERAVYEIILGPKEQSLVDQYGGKQSPTRKILKATPEWNAVTMVARYLSIWYMNRFRSMQDDENKHRDIVITFFMSLFPDSGTPSYTCTTIVLNS
jgi:hypothetical protein